MASAKDIFEANIFEANIFASGMWRGSGVATIGGPFTIDASDYYNAGSIASGSYSAGSEEFDWYNAGSAASEESC